MIKNVRLMGVAVLLLALAAGCGPNPSTPNPATARAATLFAVLTESSGKLNNPSPTPQGVQNTAIPTIPTATTGPVASATPAVTELPSVTPVTQAPSVVPTPCYRAYFVKDVTIPDYTALNPGDTFVKTWRLKNTGSCDWAADTNITFFSGTQMGGPSAQSLGQAVAVGDQIDISITLKAPTDVGTYTGYWMLRTPAGGRFGIGDAGDQSFWVLIVVKSGTTTPSLTNTLGTPTITKTPTLTRTITPIPTSTGTQTPSLTPTPNATMTCTWAYPPPLGGGHC
jgi:hypothetical protein